MLILSEEHMRQAITYDEVMLRVEEAYRILSRGEFSMPHRIGVAHGDDTLLYMPCFTKTHFGTKILSLFPGNPARGLPYINGLMLLNDAATGEILSILNGTFLTALRTGAAGGVGIRCLAPLDSHSVGIVGAGKQGYYQALYASLARNIEDIYLFDSQKKELAPYVNLLQSALKRSVRIHVCPNVEELLERSDIVVTTTTSFQPVLPNNPKKLAGKCYITIGSYKPEMRELPDALWEVAEHAYIELPFAMEESGDLAIPIANGLLQKERLCYIGDLLLADPRPAPPQRGATAIFKSVGLGLLDLVTAELIYERAQALGIGHSVTM